MDVDIDVEVDVDIDWYFGCFEGGFKVSSGTAEWYRSRSSYGTDVDNSQIASPSKALSLRRKLLKRIPITLLPSLV